MKVYGLTGGIGSGKSTVARLLRELGHVVLDADAVARDVVRPGTPGLAQLTAAFGSEILDGQGELDRKRLGALVFGDEIARRRLNGITHPLIAAETARRLAELAGRGVPVAFYEAALLVENEAYRTLDGLIVVSSDAATQRRRVEARDGLSTEEAERRLAAQTSDAERRRVANVLLDNSGTLVALETQVRALHELVTSGTPLPPPKSGDSSGPVDP